MIVRCERIRNCILDVYTVLNVDDVMGTRMATFSFTAGGGK
jgi:hypothetical protein